MQPSSFSFDGFRAYQSVEPQKFYVITSQLQRAGFCLTFELKVPDYVPAALKQHFVSEIIARLTPDDALFGPPASDTQDGADAIQRFAQTLRHVE